MIDARITLDHEVRRQRFVFLLVLGVTRFENDRDCDQSKTETAQIDLHTVLSAFKATKSRARRPLLKTRRSYGRRAIQLTLQTTGQPRTVHSRTLLLAGIFGVLLVTSEEPVACGGALFAVNYLAALPVTENGGLEDFADAGDVVFDVALRRT